MAEERERNGRFLPGHTVSKGNRGGPGRAPRTTEEKYLRAMRSVVSVKKWKEMTERALEDAIYGSSIQARDDAREWLSKYLLPTPEQIHRILGDEENPVVFRTFVVKTSDASNKPL